MKQVKITAYLGGWLVEYGSAMFQTVFTNFDEMIEFVKKKLQL